MAHHRVFGYEPGMPSKTKQEFKQECNINHIVELYKKGAPLPLQITAGQFSDVSELGDYKTALDTVMEAERVFKTLPLVIKQAVNNTAAGFIDYVNDPSNKDQLVDWGLIAGPEVPEVAVETATETPSEG